MDKKLVIYLFVTLVAISLFVVSQNQRVAQENSEQKFEDNYAPPINNSKEVETNLDDSYQQNPERDGCYGVGPVNLTSPPRSLNEIEYILPQGLVLGSHVTPIDHQYYIPHNWTNNVTEENLVDVFAPADGVVSYIMEMPAFFSHAGEGLGDYNFEIYHSCTFYTHYIHLYKLEPKLMEVLNGKEYVKVSAGEKIGSAGSFDFSVHDEDRNLEGYISPELYSTERWKIHTVDPYEYFSEPVRSLLIEKTERWTEPIGGKIDYDVDGKLRGNWFVEDTNGYKGIKQPEYWTTHFAVVPNAHDPSVFVISVGDFDGEAQQFLPKGGMDDPSTIGVEDGLLKYELVGLEYLDESGGRWDVSKYTSKITATEAIEVRGVILIQMLKDRKLKMEVFPNKSAGEVNGFTESARIYVR